MLTLGVAVPAQGDITAIRGVLHRVEGEVGEGAAQFSFDRIQACIAVDLQGDAVAALAGQGLGVLADVLQQRTHINQFVFTGVVRGFQAGQQQQVIEQCLHAVGLLLHLLQRPFPAWVEVVVQVEHGLQVAHHHGQRRAQFMGHVGDKVLAHLFQVMQPSDIAHHHQAVARPVAGNRVLQLDVDVRRRGDFQRLAEVALLEVFDKTRIADQVGNVLAAVVRTAQTDQPLGSMVPPLQVTVPVNHDHRFAQGGSRGLDTVDDGLQTRPHATVAALHVVDTVKNLAPDAARLGWRVIRVAAQPVVEARHLAQGPGQVAAQTDDQHPGGLADDPADQQADQHQQQQLTENPAETMSGH